VAKNNDMERIKKAVEFVYSYADGNSCPLCGAEMNATERQETSMKNHIRVNHPLKAVECMDQGTLEPKVEQPVDASTPIHEVAGIKTQDEYDRYDALHIPKKVRERVREEGSSLTWKAPSRLGRALDMGAVAVEREEAGSGVRQQSTEDGRVRTGEMTLVEWPAELAEVRRRQKKSRIDDQLVARKEELQKVKTEMEKTLYDEMRRRGQDHTVSLQVAQAVAGSQEADMKHGDPRRHEGLRITRD
jgi:hypothetical protein